MSKPKRKKPEDFPFCTYVVQVQGWQPRYSLYIKGKFDAGPFSEHWALDFTGTMLHPKKVEGRAIKMSIMGDRHIAQDLNSRKPPFYEPEAVGELTARGKDTDLLGWIPFDFLALIPTLISAEKLKFILMDGRELYYGKADITAFHFLNEYGPDNLIL